MYVKSPLNYTGGKHKLLSQLIPLFPPENSIAKFYDVFCGGFNVGTNYHNNIVAIDILPQLIDLYKFWKYSANIDSLEETIDSFHLSKINARGYNLLRQSYNLFPNPVYFYALIAHSFNHQIRFNSRGEFNMPFGFNRSEFNKRLKENLIKFIVQLQKKNIEFLCSDFECVNVEPDSFFYCDPPYRITMATYNEKNGWAEKDDLRLFGFLDSLNNKNIKFGLSNVIRQGNQTNTVLEKWASKYKIYHLKTTYSNCSYHKKQRDDCDEVYVTNWPSTCSGGAYPLTFKSH